MPFVDFHQFFPTIAEREVRVLTILPGGDSELPAGRYGFVDLYCNERGCDCRRVFFNVVFEGSRRPAAIISWGWEGLDFYSRWMHDGDPETARHLKGPSLEPPFRSHLSREKRLLKMADELLLSDPNYVDRIKRHYRMFRDRIEQGGAGSYPTVRGPAGDEETAAAPRPVGNESADGEPVHAVKVGRNAPCPCGSGKKYKKCCEGKSRSPASEGPPPVHRDWTVDVKLPPEQLPRAGSVEAVSSVPRDLRRRLEKARLETLVLLRCQDRARIYVGEAEFPPQLRALFELDADCAEALWGLDQPARAFSLRLMLRDTLRSLERLPAGRSAALGVLTEEELESLEGFKDEVVRSVRPEEAYNMVKGRDPEAG